MGGGAIQNFTHRKFFDTPDFKTEGYTIKTQTIRTEGEGCVIFRDYIITEDKSLINISDHVDARHTMMAYMQNYPSFQSNDCRVPASFFPLKSKRSSEESPFCGKK